MKQGIMKATVTAIIAAALIAMGFSAVAGRLALFTIAKAYDLTITFQRIDHTGLKEFRLSDLMIVDNKRGIGFSAKDASLQPRLTLTRPLVNIRADFTLHDVRLIARETAATETFDSLPGLVATPFAGRWNYREVSGSVATCKGGTRINRFAATSDMIKLNVSGNLYHDNSIAMDITVSFAPEIVAKIPDPLSSVVLNDAGQGWRSLDVKLSGNYATPSINVSSKLFRLNVRSVEGK